MVLTQIKFTLFKQRYFDIFSNYSAAVSIVEFNYVNGNFVFARKISQDSTVYTITDQVTTTTTTTEAPTTTTTTTASGPTGYFNGITLDSITEQSKDGGPVTHRYDFTVDVDVAALLSDYDGQIINNGGNKEIVVITCPVDAIIAGNSFTEFDYIEIIPYGEEPYVLDINREGYYSTHGTYDAVFKMCVFEPVNTGGGIMSQFVETIDEFYQSFSLVATSM